MSDPHNISLDLSWIALLTPADTASAKTDPLKNTSPSQRNFAIFEEPPSMLF